MLFLRVISGTIKAFLAVTLLTVIGITLDVAYNPLKPGEFPTEDIGIEIDQLVAKHGYPFETHTVVTEDGYVLQLHRIPGGGKTKKPIILMHGLLGSSVTFLISGPEKSLPYLLARNGYDVWLPNARGNFYSRKHRSLDPDANSKEFFDFSWNEIGKYDLPAVIDYVSESTGQEKVFYAGHSQGSVSFFVMLSERPEYSERIRLMVALAPVVYTKHVITPAFVYTAMFQNAAEWISEYFHELLPKKAFMTQFASKYCKDGSFLQRLCTVYICMNSGFNDPQFNTTMMPLFMSHMPAGSAMKQMLHYTQIVNSDVFRKYDHGPKKNTEIYGQDSPPEYKFENMRAPVALFYGNNDWLTLPEDLEKLRLKLPNVVLSHRVEDDLFTHFDFVTSSHAIDVLYPHILDILRKY